MGGGGLALLLSVRRTVFFRHFIFLLSQKGKNRKTRLLLVVGDSFDLDVSCLGS